MTLISTSLSPPSWGNAEPRRSVHRGDQAPGASLPLRRGRRAASDVVDALPLGDPLDETTVIGPLASSSQRGPRGGLPEVGHGSRCASSSEEAGPRT